MADELYSRQKLVEGISPVEKAIVIGVGGVGAWVAQFLAMSGTKHLILIDPDLVEDSNRARVPFAENQVGTPKVIAVATNLKNLRGTGCEIQSLQMRCEAVPSFMQADFKNYQVFDCRDNTDDLPAFYNKCTITGGYDGTTITIHKNPNYDDVFGSGITRYTITPSWVIPPVMIASLIVAYATMPALQDEKDLDRTFSIQNLFNQRIFNLPEAA